MSHLGKAFVVYKNHISVSMRTPTLQYLYLQKPVILVVILCLISVLPWINMGAFSTKGEPREAAVAVSMLETGNWILPASYADEFAYKPPMAHWLMAVFSYPEGYVSEFTSRLPSLLAFVLLVAGVLVFFGRRIAKFQEAFIATLFMMTCVEIHRAGMTARVDMLLTLFIVGGLFCLYKWEDELELKGLPVIIPLTLGCAVLTKGPVGVVLPLFIFAVYLLMLGRYHYRTLLKVLLYAGISSLFLPSLWYISAWKQGGDAFLNVVLAENFARFFHLSSPAISYDLGHENGVWFNFVTLIAGFIPWTLFFFFSLFGFKLVRPEKPIRQILQEAWTSVRSMEKVRLFSLVALVCILFFYSIPSAKRSVYLMPAYPFISLFLAQYTLYLTEYRTKVTRFFAAVLTSAVSVVLIAIGLTMFGTIDPVAIVGQYTRDSSILDTTRMATDMFIQPSTLTICILAVNVVILGIVYYQMFKKINIKILYSTIALTFAVNLLIDGVIMQGIRKGNSCKPFAERILREYPLNKENIFVMNNLKEYRNLYGLNFYMGNIFHNFEKEAPESGYFLIAETELEKFLNASGKGYDFQVLTTSDHPFSELHQRIVLCQFKRKGQSNLP